ncbi:MAG: cupin domain-containing protein [Thermomicrobiales bacterium]|nr:cupin domain-containing protein [Thermomicrobiales bacterium]
MPTNEIVNPRTGQRMLFVHHDAALLQIDTVNPPGPPEPMHVHPHQETSAEVLAGVLHFSIEGQEYVVRAGERIVIPPNVPHNFWNPGPEDAHSLQEARPALRSEEFFRDWFALMDETPPTSDGVKVTPRMIVLISSYGDVLRPTSPPWSIIRVGGLLLRPFVRLRGYRPPSASR